MHDNSTLNDPHECARRIVEALKARGLWPSNGAGVELPPAREPGSGVRNGIYFRLVGE